MIESTCRTTHAAALPTQVQRSAYDPTAHGVGIVHIGIGAFHRAHQAVYVDDVLARGGGDWRIVGISCRSSAVRDKLLPRNFLYTLKELGTGREQYRVIGSIADVLVAPQNPQAAVTAMAKATTHVISLTISEKGYCHNPATGQLDVSHPDVVHDLARPGQPRSAPGLVLAGLRERRRLNGPAPTLLCCDNLPRNGATLRRVLLDFAELTDTGLARWIEREVACPATMVDRIVPATTQADISLATEALGYEDPGLVKAETFTQWIVEDRFTGARPRLEDAGVQLVNDVYPYEIAKLRLLNGSHSMLAYLGCLAGFTFVHDVVADRDFLALVRHLMHREISPTLNLPAQFDLAAYQSALVARFANPRLQHRLRQIAMDGSQKLPQRLLDCARVRLQRAQPIEVIALAVAGWMRYVMGRDEGGNAYDVDDPLAPRIAAITAAAAGTDATALADGFLSLTDVFGRDLPGQTEFRSGVTSHLRSLLERGSRATVHAFVQRNLRC